MTEESTPETTEAAELVFAHDYDPSPRLLVEASLSSKIERERNAALARVARLEAALSPIREYVRVNDGDTLSRIAGDETVVACANGSWSKPAPITLGDLRKIVAALGGEGGQSTT